MLITALVTTGAVIATATGIVMKKKKDAKEIAEILEFRNFDFSVYLSDFQIEKQIATGLYDSVIFLLLDDSNKRFAVYKTDKDLFRKAKEANEFPFYGEIFDYKDLVTFDPKITNDSPRYSFECRINSLHNPAITITGYEKERVKEIHDYIKYIKRMA